LKKNHVSPRSSFGVTLLPYELQNTKKEEKNGRCDTLKTDHDFNKNIIPIVPINTKAKIVKEFCNLFIFWLGGRGGLLRYIVN